MNFSGNGITVVFSGTVTVPEGNAGSGKVGTRLNFKSGINLFSLPIAHEEDEDVFFQVKDNAIVSVSDPTKLKDGIGHVMLVWDSPEGRRIVAEYWRGSTEITAIQEAGNMMKEMKNGRVIILMSPSASPIKLVNYILGQEDGNLQKA